MSSKYLLLLLGVFYSIYMKIVTAHLPLFQYKHNMVSLRFSFDKDIDSYHFQMKLVKYRNHIFCYDSASGFAENTLYMLNFANFKRTWYLKFIHINFGKKIVKIRNKSLYICNAFSNNNTTSVIFQSPQQEFCQYLRNPFTIKEYVNLITLDQ